MSETVVKILERSRTVLGATPSGKSRFKHVLGCRHLLSHCKNGIELQTYSAIIACLLIALWTGRKPTLRTYRMLCWHLSGWADEGELLAHIQKLAHVAEPTASEDSRRHI